MNGATTEDKINEKRRSGDKKGFEERREKEKSKIKTNIMNADKKIEMKRLLLLGVSILQIQNILDITNEIFNQTLSELMKEYGITMEQIESAREKRRIESEEIVFDMYENGCTYEEMEQAIPYSNKTYIIRMIKRLKEDGKINKEVTERARVAKQERKEVVKESKTKKQNKKDNTKIEEREPFEEKILGYFQIGFMSKEIQKMTGLSKLYVAKIKKKLIANGEITDKEIKENVANREPKAEKRRIAIGAMADFTSDVNPTVVNEHIAYVKAKMELGEMEPKDMDLISQVIPMERELMTLGNINFVIRYFTKLDDLQYAVDFINNCLESAHDYEDEKIRKLREMKETLERKIEREKMSKRDKWLSEHEIRVNVQEKPKRGRGRPPKTPSKEKER